MALTKIDDRGLNTPIDLLDNEKIRFGAGNDLEIYHNGNHSYIKDSGTGNLILSSNQTQILNAAENEIIARFDENGAVELYYNDSKKLETKSYGVDVTGGLIASSYLKVQDNGKFYAGNDEDLHIYHDGSNTYLDNHTGTLSLRGDGERIFIKPVDGEESIIAKPNNNVELYFDNAKKFATIAAGVEVDGKIGFNNITGETIGLADNQKIRLGSSADLQIYHDGSNSYLDEGGTGSLILKSSRVSFNDTGNNEWGRFDSTGLKLVDGKKFIAGTGDDLQIYHDGTNSYIQQVTSGQNLFLKGDAVNIRSSSNESIIETVANGAVKLYHNGGKRFETHGDGATIYGQEGGGCDLNLYADEGDDNADRWKIKAHVGGDLQFQNSASGGWETNITAQGNGGAELWYDNSKKFETNSTGAFCTGQLGCDTLYMGDNDKAKFGGSDDLQIYHDGSNSWISNINGDIEISNIHNNSDDIWIRTTDDFGIQVNKTEHGLYVNANGSCQLYYDNSKKFDTDSIGIVVTGRVKCDELNLADSSGAGNNRIKCGDGDDLYIYHDGTESYITNTTGNLYLNTKSNQTAIRMIPDGGTKLYHQNNLKIETDANGVTVTGRCGRQEHFVTIFTSSGTFTPHVNANSFEVWATGGGGSGGNANHQNNKGSGGGGGGTAIRPYSRAQMGANASVTIGGGGTGVGNGNNGGNGGGTTFDPAGTGTTIVGGGGSGGNAGNEVGGSGGTCSGHFVPFDGGRGGRASINTGADGGYTAQGHFGQGGVGVRSGTSGAGNAGVCIIYQYT